MKKKCNSKQKNVHMLVCLLKIFFVVAFKVKFLVFVSSLIFFFYVFGFHLCIIYIWHVTIVYVGMKDYILERKPNRMRMEVKEKHTKKQ